MVIIDHKRVCMTHAIAGGNGTLGVCVSGRQIRVFVLDDLGILR